MIQSDGNTTRSFVRARKPSQLSESLHRHLNSYALAASAAGVTLLACSAPAGAAPVCKNVSVILAGNDTYALNPSGLEFAPFNIAQTYENLSSLTTNFWNRGFLTPNSARAMGLLGAKGFPAALVSGASIGPGGHFGKGKSYGMLFSYGPVNGGTKKHHQGNFQFGQANYFGLRFAISGEDHYGWVRLKVTFGRGFDGTATYIHIPSYGYETTPNTAIRAGQCSAWESSRSALPSSKEHVGSASPKNQGKVYAASLSKPVLDTVEPPSLGMLALGVQGLPLWRRKEDS